MTDEFRKVVNSIPVQSLMDDLEKELKVNNAEVDYCTRAPSRAPVLDATCRRRSVVVG